ncbi:MAG: hypothetical protein QUS14_15605, partial [Pyrinomonadaceae bacterium]|nr:hypothetical protein [Pyrinomonadaceae bacterium]
MQLMLRFAATMLFACCVLVSAAFAQEEPAVTAVEKPRQLNRFGIVVENSGVSRLALERSVKVLSSLLKSDLGASEIFLVSYADSEKIRLRVDFTSDKFELIDTVENLYAESGSGAFLDAVKLAADHLSEAKEASEPGLLVISVSYTHLT